MGEIESMWRREELIRSAEESRHNELESLIRSPGDGQ